MTRRGLNVSSTLSEISLRTRELAWLCVLSITLVLLWMLGSFGPFLVAAMVGGVVVSLALVRYPWFGVLLLVVSVPAQEFGAIAVGGQTLTLTRAMFPLAVAGYVISLLVKNDRLRGSRLVVPFGLLVGIMLISIIWATTMPAAGAEVGRWLTAFIAFVILLHFLIEASEKRITVFVVAMALAGAFQATYGVTQSVLAIGPESFRVGDQGSRAFGTFGQPNSYAGYLEMVFFPVVFLGILFVSRLSALLSHYREMRQQGFYDSRPERLQVAFTLVLAGFLIISSIFILGGILASYSRGAWLGIATGGLLTAILYHRWIRRGAVVLLPAIFLLALGGAQSFLPEAVGERVSSGFADLRPFDASSVPVTDENFAAAERMAHWQAGWRMFDDQPLTGVGAGNFNERYQDYFVREQFQFSRGHAHNYYIHLLAEVGLAGLSAYAFLVASLVFLALRVIMQAPNGFERMLALGAFGTIVSVGVHNVFENLHVLNLSIQLGATWALTVAAHRRWIDVARSSALENDT